ncbi:MAG: PilZ domain-containing protein [Nitrospirae bacterium]|nr:MAG: PilZ domain-containing protein [Nitrospirota bacterium]
MELRSHPRVQTTMRVSFSSHDFDGLKDGTLYNISVSGCAVESPTTVAQGTHVALYLHTPDEQTPITIDLAAVVQASRREFAVKFILVQPDEKRRLEQLIQKQFKASA